MPIRMNYITNQLMMIGFDPAGIETSTGKFLYTGKACKADEQELAELLQRGVIKDTFY